MTARLHLEIAIEDGGFLRVPTYVALYVVLGDRFERVTKPNTFQIDYYGDQHVVLEPEYTLYEDGDDVLVEEEETLYLRKPDGTYAIKNGTSDEGRALVARFGPPREIVVARSSAVDALMALPTSLVMHDERLVATNQSVAIDVGSRSSLLVAGAKPESGSEMLAELCLMNEGALVRVYEGWYGSPERPRSLFLMRPGATSFERVDSAEWPRLEAAIERRPGAFRIEIP